MKTNARTFFKNSTTQKNIRISRLKKSWRNVYNKVNFKPELSNTLDKTLCSYLFSLSQSFWLGGLGFQFLWDLIFLSKVRYRNKLIQVIQVASINTQSKTKIIGLLSESFTLIQRFH